MPQLPEDELAHVFIAAKSLSNTMLRGLEAQGTNLIVANGVAAGQRAQHFMVHIIPRKENDGVTFTLPQKTLGEEQIESVGNKIIESITGEAKETISVPKLQIPTVEPSKQIDVNPAEKETKKFNETPKKTQAKQGEKKEGIDLDDIAKLLGVK